MAVSLLIFMVGAIIVEASCLPDADRHIAEDNVAIIGGHQILIEKVPFMASLRCQQGNHYCGASIIHEQFVLTAAHCIKPGVEYKVMVGTDNVNGDGILFDVEKIITHHKYNKTSYEFDFCVIKLKSAMTFGAKIDKINLDSPRKMPKGTTFNVTGWGSTGSVRVSPKLLQVELPFIKRKECVDDYKKKNYIITPRMICAGIPGHDSCQGDSGGPLTLGDKQVGVTSFGGSCGGDLPGVYARVSAVKPWIENLIGKQ